MKNKSYLYKLLHSDFCAKGMVEKVIAFAEGRLDEKEYPEIYAHLAECNYCRYMLEDMDIIPEYENYDKKQSPKICMKLDNDTIIPLNHENVINYNTASVLSSKGNESIVDYNITSFSNPTLLRAIAHKDTIVIEIHTNSNDVTYWLINNEKSVHTNVYNGVAIFENIEKGIYLLSENMKDFCVIEIQ
ncbi:MAG: zf-HC2 domain-containing protein [Spirochaetota bacterium]|nr:zf-HC2 domain-containing protein [Spirochaetota bacterium]